MTKLEKNEINEETKIELIKQIFNAQAESGLTPGQFVYLCLLYLEDYASIYKYCQEIYKQKKVFPFTKEEINQLYTEKLITETWNSLYPDDAIITSKGRNLIEKVLQISSNSLSLIKEKIEKFGEELISVFPDQFYGTNGQRYPTKGFSRTSLPNGKYIEGKYQLMKYYYELINGSEEKHREIISKIQKGKELNGSDNRNPVCHEIRTTLMKFVVNEMWKTMKVDEEPKTPLLKIV